MGHDILPAPESTISVPQLAQRLGLTIDPGDGSPVSLRNPANTVAIFPSPAARIYVNGRPLDVRGDIVRISGVTFVPASFEGPIRSALRPVPEPVKPTPTPTRFVGRRIVIDPGHGGKDPGTISPIGLMEKDVVLPVALEVARLLRAAGHEVILSRSTDIFVELDERAHLANRHRADLFFSIHADSAPNPEARGSTVYICRGASADSNAIAHAVMRSLESGSGLGSRGVKSADYRVLVLTQCPAILVELGYLSNRHEALMLRQDGVRRKVAASIAAGIDASLRRAR